MLLAEAYELLGLEQAAEDEATVNKAFRVRALVVHPDKDPSEEATALFQQLVAARDMCLEALLDGPEEEKSARRSQFRDWADVLREMDEKEDARRNEQRRFEDEVDPRAAKDAGQPVNVAWRCTECEPQFSLCVKVIRTNMYKCLCGCKVADHDAKRAYACARCPCSRLAWLPQDKSWFLRCGCKHKGEEHGKRAPRACTKLNCKCDGWAPNWVCLCGHSGASHVTAFTTMKFPPKGGREWVTHGLRPETIALARANRNKRIIGKAHLGAAPPRAKGKAKGKGKGKGKEATGLLVAGRAK